jgi:hypothetical protein
VLAIAGCSTAQELAAQSQLTASPSPSGTPEAPQPEPLPADAVLGFSAIATADNGAVLDISIVVHSSVIWNAGEGLVRSTATTANCSGELDESVYSSTGWGFSRVDLTATLRAGSVSWPDDLVLQALPLPNDRFTIAPVGDVYQVEAPAPEPAEPGYYVPQCVQNAFMNAPGTGSTYLGFTGDAAAGFTSWANESYGVTFDGFEPMDPNRVELTECVSVITPLGASLGAPSTYWGEYSEGTSCQVGGTA